jgi:hypothetical protein
MKMEEDQKVEVEALCPECGHAFKAYVDRIFPEKKDPSHKAIDCPICGCGECNIAK